MSDRGIYVGPELRQLMEEHGLTRMDVTRTDVRHVYRYLNDERRMQSCRWRLLHLELGLERPYWTREKRLKRMLAEYTGGIAPPIPTRPRPSVRMDGNRFGNSAR